MRPIKWTDAHWREAFRAILRAVDAWSAKLDKMPRSRHLGVPAECFASEPGLREALARTGMTGADIDREVRRVDKLARGVLVRESGWRGTSHDGSTLAWTARAEVARRWRETGARVVHVARVRVVKP